MAIIKISELPAADSPLLASDVVPALQDGVTKKAAINQFGYLPSGSGAVTRTIQDKLRESVSVKDFGAIGNGTADDTAAIQAAMSSGAKNVIFPEGTYVVSSEITVPPNVTVKGAGVNGTIINGTGVSSGYVFNFGNGTVTLIGSVSAGTIGQATLTLTGAPSSTVNPNDTVVVWNPTTFSWSTARAYYRQGEFCRIQSVSGSTLNLAGTLYDTYAAPSQVYLMPNDANSLSDMTILAPKNAASSSAGAVSFSNLVAGSMERVWVYGGINTSVTTVRCTNFSISACRIEDNIINDSGDDYPLSIANCQSVYVSDCFVVGEGGHSITMGGSGAAVTPVTRDIKISSCLISSKSGYSADTHGDCEYITYDNCTIDGGALLAGNNIVLSNNIIRGTRDGLSLIRVYETKGTSFSFVNNQIQFQTTSAGTGLNFQSGGATTVGGFVEFKNNKIEFLSSALIRIQNDQPTLTNHHVVYEGNTVICPSNVYPFFQVLCGSTGGVAAAAWESVRYINNDLSSSSINIAKFGTSVAEFIANSLVIDGNEITNTNDRAVLVEGAKNIVVKNNVIRNSTNNAISIVAQSVTSLTPGDVIEITENTFINNVKNAPALSLSLDSDIYAVTATSIVIAENNHVNTNATKPAYFLQLSGTNVYAGNYAGMYTPRTSPLSITASNYVSGSAKSTDNIAITGSTISAAGTNSDVNISLTPKGSGFVVANSDATINTLRVGAGASGNATNTALGVSTLRVNSTGTSNTGVGHNSFFSLTSGSQNVAVGRRALYTNDGSNNVAVGHDSLYFNSTANNNVGVGLTALYSNSTGNSNTAIGTNALYTNSSAAQNTAVGEQSLFLTTGANNTAIGFQSGDKISTGTQNVCVGHNAASSGTNDLTTGSNNIVIGYNAEASSATVSNEGTYGNDSITLHRFAGQVKAARATAIPAGGAQNTAFTATSTANFGVFFGSGAPTVSAAKGSLYLRSDGSTTNDRAYINTDGGTTWTALTTAA